MRSGSAPVISLSLGSVNVVDGRQKFLTSLLVYMGAQTNVHQVGELLHGVLLHTDTASRSVKEDMQTEKQNDRLNKRLFSSSSHPVILDKLLHVVLRQVVRLDVRLNELFIRDGSQVGQLLQLHEELLEVQLHQSPALVAAFLHVSVAAAEDRGG